MVDAIAKEAEASPTLKVEVSSCTRAGLKSVNEDAIGVRDAADHFGRVDKGVCGIVADGVSSAEAGREASHTATTQFVDQYFQSPDTWSTKHAGQNILSTINLSLFKRSHEFTHLDKGYLCTFTGLIIKSRMAHFFHVGDSRLYRLRGSELQQITIDHCINLGADKQILSRAVGMDSALNIDYGTFPIELGDIYFLTTDGVHDFINAADFSEAVEELTNIDGVADRLVDLALAKGADDNLSCICLRIEGLPNESMDDFNEKLTRLPFPPDLALGTILDGFEIIEEMFASSRSQVYRVKDTATGHSCVMKTPSRNFEDDVGYIDKFIQEEWVGKRIDSPYVVKIVEQSTPRTCLYYLMEEVEGCSLDRWMKANRLPKPSVAIDLVRQIGKALQAFHDQEIIHQDLKPANIMVGKNNEVTVIDFGSVYVAGLAEVFIPFEHEGALGTASYSDPQFLMGRNSHTQSDLYSLATITYELFTGHLPYGQRIDHCQTRYDFERLKYHSSRYHNPRIPVWFDRALEKGCAISLAARYDKLGIFLADLNKPNPEYLQDDPALERSQGRFFWQALSAIWILMMLLVIGLFVN